MNKVLWIFIAFAFGLMFFASLQDDLPDELAFLKSKGALAGSRELPAQTAALANGHYQMGAWVLRKENSAVELIKAFAAAPGSPVGTSAQLGILCANGQLGVRIDAGGALRPRCTVKLDITGLGNQAFTRGPGSNLIAKSPGKIKAHLASTGFLAVSLPLERTDVNVVLDGAGLGSLLDLLPETCR